MVKTATIQSKLSELLARFPEIGEAYVYMPSSDEKAILLGLLHKGMNSDRRHYLFEEVAKLSRQYLGSTDAIDIYDDLVSKRTSSWDLFSSVTPFYFLEEAIEEGQESSRVSWAKVGQGSKLLIKRLVKKKRSPQ